MLHRSTNADDIAITKQNTANSCVHILCGTQYVIHRQRGEDQHDKRNNCY